MRGQTVTVEVAAEGARLEFEAQAEAAGDTGDVVAMRNPSSRRRFLASDGGTGQSLGHDHAGQGNAMSIRSIGQRL